MSRYRKKYSVSQIVFWIVSVLIVVSMIVGFVLSAMPMPAPPSELTPQLRDVTPGVSDSDIGGHEPGLALTPEVGSS